MSKRLFRYFFCIYPRNSLKRNLCLCFLLFSLCIFVSLRVNSTNSSPSSHDLLDECMLDHTPCLPDIKQGLNRYFRELQTRYAMLLTYHPTIDCDHGRYLLINNDLASHVYHGTGSQLMWYLGILNVAYALNLTLIHLEWTAEHSDDENNQDRDRYWQFSDWQIPFASYQSCPRNSSVKRHIFKYNLLAKQTFDQHHQGKQPFTLVSSFQKKLAQFVSHLPDKNTGFTLYSNQTYTIISSLMEIGVVFETRWWLQHRKLYNPLTGVWSGLAIESNYEPKDYFQYFQSESIECPAIDPNENILIGLHIRHGDVVKRDREGQIVSNRVNFYRYISNSAYVPLLIAILNHLPAEIREKYLITIYSEGVAEDFLDILYILKNSLAESSRCRLAFFLNGRTSETFNRLLRDDIILSAHSTFSLATGIFNSRQLKIGPAHNHARVHGMRNFLSLEINKNHTRFQITDEKLVLIKQRIEYVWREKQKQLNTPIPLWLENYSQDYPEEFMLI